MHTLQMLCQLRPQLFIAIYSSLSSFIPLNETTLELAYSEVTGSKSVFLTPAWRPNSSLRILLNLGEMKSLGFWWVVENITTPN